MELVKHETCLEYFRRRLSEGWECISLEGYNAVLLSPGGIRRKLDLRNDVETLRPSGVGSETNITGSAGAPTHWECVDEAVPDGHTTEVSEDDRTVYHRDLYALPVSSGSGTINKITVFFCCFGYDSEDYYYKASIKSNGDVTDGTEKMGPSTGWETFSQEWANNPSDAGAWAWADIDALEAGVSMHRSGSSSGWAACTQVYVEVDYTTITVPTVTAQAATDKEDTTATSNGNITAIGGENCDERGAVWDLASHVDPGDVAPGASGYANNPHEHGDFGAGAFTIALAGLPTGRIIYVRMYAHNSAGYDYSNTEISFLTKPAKPTGVAATSNLTDRVRITWNKSTGADDYHVWRGGVDLGAAGDVDTFDDFGAAAGIVTPGVPSASDGTFVTHVALSLAGESVAAGTVYSYKVVASNATGDSDDSTPDNGNRSVGGLTYQWLRSAADADAAFGAIGGATTDPYNDTGAPANGEGRWYYCEVSATGAVTQDSTHDRGYRWIGGKTAHMAAKLIGGNLI